MKSIISKPISSDDPCSVVARSHEGDYLEYVFDNMNGTTIEVEINPEFSIDWSKEAAAKELCKQLSWEGSLGSFALPGGARLYYFEDERTSSATRI